MGHLATERPFPKVFVVPIHFPNGIYIEVYIEVTMKSENNFLTVIHAFTSVTSEKILCYINF